MLVFEEEEIFCSSDVKFHGQPVGILLANTSDLANKAAEFVDITYEGIKSDFTILRIKF